MRYNRLDLNLLIALDALLEERSVSRAAQRVFLSQPAMSNALGRLREHYGDELVVSVGRRMVLTERGESLQREVRDLMLRIQQVAQPGSKFDPTTDRRTFSIAASDYFSLVVLPELLQYCAVHAPAICLDVQPLSPRLSDEIDRGDVDLLIIPDVYRFSQHCSQTLFQDIWVCVAAADNDVVRKGLTSDAYFSASHVVKRENNTMFQPLDEMVLSRRRVVRNVYAKVPQYGLLAPAVSGTPHLATVQKRMAELFAKTFPIQLLPLPIELPPLIELMQWHELREADSGHQWLREAVALVCRRIGDRP